MSAGEAQEQTDRLPDRGADPRLERGPFSGKIGLSVAESTPWWPEPPARGQRPNVVVVLLDDVGFAQLGCFGASIRTPNVDALAAGGLRYTNFHVAALCSPTRASLLTGRNHHAVGMGFLSAFDTGFPGYRGAVTPRAATLAEMLRDEGFGTYAVGKWHLAPPPQMSPAGPFHHWPTQRGFDRFYGFLLGEDDQYAPELWYDQHRVDIPDKPGYHLSEDLVERSREFIADHVTSRPNDPFFLYLALGAGHAPHQAPREYIDRYRGQFDHGWDVERERVLARQIALGVVPPDTVLPPRNPGVQVWADLPPEEQRLYARMQEVFAGFLEHADVQIGRLVAFLRQYDLLEDTLLVVLSDNGASGEGGEHGLANEYRYFLGLGNTLEDNLAAYDQLGGPEAHNHYPAGWAQAGNTPLRYYKKHTYGGGVRSPMVMHWPNRLDRTVPFRTQFHHAIDLVPTVLEVAGATAPAVYRGVEQMPVHGISMAYTFGHDAGPSRRRLQYFETVGYRGLYQDGWKAVTDHEPGQPFDRDRWALYRLDDDFSESKDRSEELPERVEAMCQAWFQEAEKYDVLPLDDRMGARAQAQNPGRDRGRYVMLPGTRLLNPVVGPNFSARGFSVTATVEPVEKPVEGVLLAFGRRASGFTFFVKDNRLAFDYNLAGSHTLVEAPTEIPAGAVELRLSVERRAGAAWARLAVDGETVVEAPLPRLLPGGLGPVSVQCGYNAPSAVSYEYRVPFPFTGTMDRVVIDLEPRAHSTTNEDWVAEMARQ